jgi:hypothetical protein
MRRVVPLLIAVAALSFAPGVAAAEQETYEVRDSWRLTYVDGNPTIVPEVEDDFVEVTCHNEDMMTDWRVNDEELVDESRERADGTGIQVKPEFPEDEDTEILAITVVCQKA